MKYLRVPSKRVAIVSRKVFCGARSPFLAGMMAYLSKRQVPHYPHVIHHLGEGWAFRDMLEYSIRALSIFF